MTWRTRSITSFLAALLVLGLWFGTPPLRAVAEDATAPPTATAEEAIPAAVVQEEIVVAEVAAPAALPGLLHRDERPGEAVVARPDGRRGGRLGDAGR